MEELLTRFCAVGEQARPWLCAPWSAGAWVYYSDGRVVVRVPHNATKHERIAALDFDPAAKMFADHFSDGGEFVVLPKLNEPAICGLCEGERVHDGSECFVCCGTGHQQEAVPMFDAPWSDYYVWLFGQLPQVRIRAPKPSPNPEKPFPAPLIFDGGQGLLMPRRA